MQAVGKLGRCIWRSVDTVSGPFHPFGGAVDIIVVEQPDGSFKSSPWYVRFGKFQGVLKAKEKAVSISVNGVEANFHMYLDHKGGAFFLREVDVEEGDCVCSPPSSSGEDADRESENGVALTRTSSRRSQILGLVFGGRSMKGNECGGVIRTESLERAEIAADLLELKWSTNLASSRLRKDNGSRLSSLDVSKDDDLEVNGCYDEIDRVSRSSNQEGESTSVETSVEISECVIERETSVESVGEDTNLSDLLAFAKSDCHLNSMTIISKVEDDSLKDVYPQSVVTVSSSTDSNCSREEEQTIVGQDEIKKNGRSLTGPLCDPQISSRNLFTTCILASRISEEEKLLFGDMDDFGSIDAKVKEFIHDDKENDSSFLWRVADGVNESGQEKGFSGFPLDQSIIDDYIKDDDILHGRRLKTISSDVCNNNTGNVKSKELTRTVRSLPIMEPRGNNIEASDVGFFSDPLLHPGEADNNNLSPDDQTTLEYVKMSEEIKDGPGNPSIGGDSRRSLDSLRGSGKIWPFSFRKSKSMKVSHSDMNVSENLNDSKNVSNAGDLEGVKEKPNKKYVKILTPTSEQLASLKLKEGKNTIVFTFSTSMLGKQQVDARIFLWRWDTRIVISDVDGTITRSDLLGQVMPFVGRDWSQTGVVHLFSAIKENGYQLLFLSARSISQAFHTRQFLFNIRQDGKDLPEGPVVISPDGLFPSLFREVVRRAPHEFKIGCLEDIKALFPADRNPFYAGFGNRDTDEFSYLKVGIPMGKIFIINPKGEIVVNRGVNTKSYLSIHTLVNAMFPTMSSEKEDFNSYNYWKLPLPLIDI